jgi:carbonic anhydrase
MSNKRALGGNKSSVIDNWLTGVRDVYRLHKTELDAIADPEERHRRLVEKNVIEQCLNIFKTGVVQHHRLKTFHNKEKYKTKFAFPRVHAMVFDPADGLLQQLQVDFKVRDTE